MYHRYTSWQKSRLNEKMVDLPAPPPPDPEDPYGSKPVNIYNIDETLEYAASSHNDGRKYLGMSTRSLGLYTNNSKSFYSKKLTKSVTLREPDFLGETVKKPIVHEIKNASPLTLYNLKLTDLSTLFLYFFF